MEIHYNNLLFRVGCYNNEIEEDIAYALIEVLDFNDWLYDILEVVQSALPQQRINIWVFENLYKSEIEEVTGMVVPYTRDIFIQTKNHILNVTDPLEYKYRIYSLLLHEFTHLCQATHKYLLEYKSINKAVDIMEEEAYSQERTKRTELKFPILDYDDAINSIRGANYMHHGTVLYEDRLPDTISDCVFIISDNGNEHHWKFYNSETLPIDYNIYALYSGLVKCTGDIEIDPVLHFYNNDTKTFRVVVNDKDSMFDEISALILNELEKKKILVTRKVTYS